MAGQGQGRVIALDAVRGFAVMGILVMNIVTFGMPGYAYIDPTQYGLAGPADMTAWAITYAVADGKMRALFTMLFGASMVLIADRAAASGESASTVHYRRIFWLFVIGMIHAWFFWYGDILVQYAVGGAIGFFLWKRGTRWLLVFAGAMLLLLNLALNYVHYHDLATTRAAAEAPGASAEAIDAWREKLADEVPDGIAAEREVAGYRGGFADVFATRAPTTKFFQTFFLPLGIPEILCFMAFGIALYRSGFFSGAWATRSYWTVLGLGWLVAIPLYIPIERILVARDFDLTIMPLTDSASLLLRPFVATAHAAAIVLLVKSGAVHGLTDRLAAAGRMAFSNYLGTTLICTTLFYGYGFGVFGHLSRAELYWVVAGVWAFILLWSKPWLARFRYGPFEWLWRSLARGELQAMSKYPIAMQSHSG